MSGVESEGAWKARAASDGAAQNTAAPTRQPVIGRGRGAEAQDARRARAIAGPELGDVLRRGVAGRELPEVAGGRERRLHDHELAKPQQPERVRGDEVQRERAALVEDGADEIAGGTAIESRQQPWLCAAHGRSVRRLASQ